MMKQQHTSGAFTLLELLMVIGIIACLASLMMPALTVVRQKADGISCVSNLRQIGIAAQLYAGEHSQTTPVIEPWPSDPVYPAGAGAQTILAALQPYGVTAATLRCRADLNGPNFNSKEGSSYEWCPMANGQNVRSVKLVWSGNLQGVTLSQLLMAFDYSNVHSSASNVLFGDGHVAAGN